MTTLRRCLLVIIPLLMTACYPTLVTEPPLPTRMLLPSPAPTSTPTATPTVTATPTPSITQSPTASPSLTVTDTRTPTSTRTPTPTDTATPRPPLPDAFTYGKSAEGRDLYARRFGTGDQLLMLVGGIHTGFEANTVMLVNQMIDHFETHPQDVLPGVILVLIPTANPDGLARGRTVDGRFNAHGIDLNRNWGCDWSATAVWHDQTVNPGPLAFSEPESQALAALIHDLRPNVVLFYHAAARGVFAGDCHGSSVSMPMAEVLGKATGYPYGAPFTNYAVTGTASNWVDGLGIPSADVELATADDTELVRNLNGVMALQHWLTGT